jgi:hypothetical protein
VSPWLSPDQRSLVFTPGASIGEGLDPAAEDADSRLASAQGRIDTLLRRCDVETDLRGEITPGKRPIEVE